jgi:hypothetical protein
LVDPDVLQLLPPFPQRLGKGFGLVDGAADGTRSPDLTIFTASLAVVSFRR